MSFIIVWWVLSAKKIDIWVSTVVVLTIKPSLVFGKSRGYVYRRCRWILRWVSRFVASFYTIFEGCSQNRAWFHQNVFHNYPHTLGKKQRKVSPSIGKAIGKHRRTPDGIYQITMIIFWWRKRTTKSWAIVRVNQVDGISWFTFQFFYKPA